MTIGSAPLPERFNTCGLIFAPSVTVTLLFTPPVLVGLKLTENLHELPGGNGPPQGEILLVTSEKVPSATTLEMLTDVLPPLVTVTVLFALVLPTAIFPKFMDEGEKLSGPVEPPVPVPASDTICGLNAAPYVTASEPLMVPLVLGLNVTAIVHLAFGASVVGHGCVPVPFALYSPLAEKATVIGEAPLLVSVAVCGWLLLPIAMLPNAIAAGDTDTGFTPDPNRPSTWGEPLALSATVMVPGMEPVNWGVNTTETLQP